MTKLASPSERVTNPPRYGSGLTLRERFLATYADHGEPYASYKAFCEEHGFNYRRFLELRRGKVEFRREIELIESRWKRTGGRKGPKPHPGRPHTALAPTKPLPQPNDNKMRERWSHLEEWKGLFLDSLRGSNDRIGCARAVDRTWTEIEEALEADSEFMSAYREIQRENKVAAEDALTRNAIAGKNNAATVKFLEVHHSSYQKRKGGTGEFQVPREALNDEERMRARGVYRSIFAKARSAGGIVELVPPDPPEFDGPTLDEMDGKGGEYDADS